MVNPISASTTSASAETSSSSSLEEIRPITINFDRGCYRTYHIDINQLVSELIKQISSNNPTGQPISGLKRGRARCMPQQKFKEYYNSQDNWYTAIPQIAAKVEAVAAPAAPVTSIIPTEKKA